MTRTRCLIAAALFHVALTITVFLIGYFKLIPSVFNEFGVGIGFAADAMPYRNLANEVAVRWHTEGIGIWLDTPSPLHLRLHTVVFHFLGPLLGYNILAAEPLNLFFYLCILSLVYLLAKELFDERVAKVSAVIVGLWPTLLIHSTQLLRDPLSIACMLGIIFLLTILLTRKLLFKQALALTIAGIFTLIVLWLARGNVWNLIVIFQLLAGVLLLVQVVRERKLNWNAPVLVIVFVASLIIPGEIDSMTIRGLKPPTTPLAITDASSTPGNTWQRLIKQLGARRAGFRVYGPQGSNVDADVRLNTTGDVIRFLPRATEIGVLAPFPKMWVQTGNVGRFGRMASGLETLAMYVCYALSLVCLWHERRRLAVWFPVLAALVGMILLGLVVVNVGALFRLRYIFWVMLIPFGVRGLQLTAETLRARRST